MAVAGVRTAEVVATMQRIDKAHNIAHQALCSCMTLYLMGTLASHVALRVVRVIRSYTQPL